MGPTAYALCKKPVIGLLMFISNACAFPPLVLHEPLSLTTAQSSASAAFTVKVEKTYTIALAFEFPDVAALGRDQVVGSRYDSNCEPGVKFEDIPAVQREGLGNPIAVHVVVRRRSDQALVIDQDFTSLCLVGTATATPTKSRQVGRIALTRGDYVMEVTNLQAQPGLDGVKTSFSLITGYGK
jgi:hypothetical protein